MEDQRPYRRQPERMGALTPFDDDARAVVTDDAGVAEALSVATPPRCDRCAGVRTTSVSSRGIADAQQVRADHLCVVVDNVSTRDRCSPSSNRYARE
jgi:hypothetical protein